jgi:hypothetical protein
MEGLFMAGRKWTEEEIEFVRQNYKSMTCGEMGEKLNRTERSVEHLSAKLNLVREAQVGDRFNRLTIREKFIENKYNQRITFVICDCDCGKEHITKLTSIVNNHTKSCGCLKDEKARDRTIERNFKHGESDLKNNRLYRIWSAMKTRCYSVNTPLFKNYGGRGIIICDEWKENFLTFKNWSIKNNYSDELTIDRINVNGNYEPSNCRWVDRKVQAQNRRNNRHDTIKITAFGENKAIGNWLEDSRCLVKSIATICYRIGAGWSPEEAISKPSERRK